MCCIIFKLTECWSKRTNINIITRSSRMFLQIKPETKTIWACNMIVCEKVCRMRDPESCRPQVSFQQRLRLSNLNCKIMVIIVICLNSVLDEERVTHSVVSNVFFDSKIVNTMGGYSSIIWVVNCVTYYVGFVNISYHMEMNRVTAKLKGLTNVLHFDIANVTYTWIISRWGHHNVSSVLVNWGGFGVTSKENISCQKSNLSSHRHIDAIKVRRDT